MPGWIKLHRKIEDNPLFQDKPFCKTMAWIDLLLLANHEDADFMDRRGNVVEGKQGTVYRSIVFLSDRWGWSKNKVNHFLKQLVKMEMIEKKSSTQGTTLTIVNYGDYQKQGSTKGSTQGKPEGSSKEAQGKPEDTYKKNIKKDKKKDKENNTPLRGKYFDDPNEFLNDTKYLDDYLECESFAHEDVERAVLIRRMELGLDDPNDENVKKRRKELGLDE